MKQENALDIKNLIKYLERKIKENIKNIPEESNILYLYYYEDNI